MQNLLKILLYLFLVLVTIFLRFTQLGFSDFYGDETKVFYLRKDVSAKDHLLNQRKGPVQFLVAWSAEKTFGTYDELTTRIPFAIAGTLAVFAFYFVVRLLFDEKIAYLSTLLFSLNGFFIAFSRTVQYQSFLLLFGFLSILFTLFYIKSKDNPQKLNEYFDKAKLRFKSILFLNKLLSMLQNYFFQFMLFLTGIFLALAYLSHWDAVFFDIAVGTLFIKYFFYIKGPNFSKKIIKEFLVYLLIPFLLVLGTFFIPYITQGYFSEQVSGYMSRRLSGSSLLPNDSLLTYQIYNISLAFLLIFAFAINTLTKRYTFEKIFLLIWFVVPFVLFEFVISNPGTHIYNYVIPLLILASIGFFELFDCINGLRKKFLLLFGIILLLSMIYASSFTFVPSLNNGYPWNKIAKQKQANQIFLYGFPYKGGWQDIRAYFGQDNGVNRPRSFYTNDNVTIGEYYLYGVPAVIPNLAEGSMQLPQYYIDVKNNQEFREVDDDLLEFYEEVYEGDGFTIYKATEL